MSKEDNEEAAEAMTENQRRKFDEALIDKHLDALIEHYEAVQIIVTRKGAIDKETTAMHARGRGNYYMRYGMIDHWLRKERGS